MLHGVKIEEGFAEVMLAGGMFVEHAVKIETNLYGELHKGSGFRG